ncbi:MAG: hypothetical protein RL096_618, partial [Actinomycetota bacterium]
MSRFVAAVASIFLAFTSVLLAGSPAQAASIYAAGSSNVSMAYIGFQGGSEFSPVNCGSESLVTSIMTTTGGTIAQGYGARCNKFGDNGAQIDGFQTLIYSPINTVTTTRICPTGQVVIGIKVNKGTYAISAGAICADPGTWANESYVGDSSETVESRCAVGSAVIGIWGRSGSSVDAMGIVCRATNFITLPTTSNTGAVTYSGNATVGNTFTATQTYNNATSISYQWQVYNTSSSAWENISGATSSTFTATLAQVGKQIRVSTTGNNSSGSSAASVTSATSALGLATPTRPDLQASSDFGFSSTDNYTNDNTPTFDLAGYEVGADVIITGYRSYPSAVTVTCEVLLTTSGNQNCTFPALADGTYSITAIQRKGSTSSSATTGFNLTIRTVGPRVNAIQFVPALTKNHTVNVEITYDSTIWDTPSAFSQDAIELSGISSGWTVSSLARHPSNSSKVLLTLTQSGNLVFEGDLTITAKAGLAQDQFGQQSLASAITATGNFDETRPWAAWSGTPTAGTNKGKTADKLPLTLTFSEPIRSLDATDFSFTGVGATGCAAEVSATSIAQNATSPYAVTVNITSCTANGLVNVTLNADSVHDYTDTTGNLGPATALTASFTRDITAPTITAISKTVDGTDVNYEVTFSEPVAGFTAADITVAHTLAGEAANWTIGTVTLKAGTDSTYLFTVSNSNAKTGTLSISISGAGVTDLPGNTLTATMPITSGGNVSNATLYYLPRFTINTLTMIGPDAVELASNFVLDGRGGSITGFRINLTNAQSGDTFGFTSTSGFASSSSSTSNNGVSTATITISASNKTDGEWQAAIRNITIRNTAGSSASTASRNFEFVVTPNNTYAGDSVADGLSQTATTTVDLIGPALSSFTTTAPTGRSNVAGFTVNFTFSEAFRNFANTDVVLSGTGTTGCTVGTPTAASDGTAPYESAVTITGCSGNGTIIATLAANSINDMVGPTGNAGPVATQLASFTRDAVAPTLSSVAKTTGELSVTYEYAFSESIDGLDIDALTISHTGTGGTTGWSMSTPTIKSGTTSTYVFTLSRTTEVSGDLSITLKTADVTDLAGNPVTGTGAVVDGSGQNASLVTFYYLPTFDIGALTPGGKVATSLAPTFALDAKGGTVAGLRVKITNNRQTGDTLAFTNNSSTNFGSVVSASSTSGTLELTYTGSAPTATQWQNAFRAIKYSNTDSAATNATRSFEFHVRPLLGYVYETEHFYEFVPTVGTYAVGKAAAANLTFSGLQGYLMTPSTQAEMSWLSTINDEAWIAVYDKFANEQFYWDAGPTNGQLIAVGERFWGGNQP